MAPLARRTQAWLDMMRNHYANYGRQSRSAAGAIFPHLDRNPSTLRQANPRPQGSVASRMYPNLPSSAAARMKAPKAKPRVSRARRIYANLE
jgi:hypothetical protein